MRIFATMNPASVGGSRMQLPRSIQALFNTARLAAPTAEELGSITQQLYAPCVAKGWVQAGSVSALMRLHQHVAAAQERREVGKQAGMADLNLRDLIKVLACMHAPSAALSASTYGWGLRSCRGASSAPLIGWLALQFVF